MPLSDAIISAEVRNQHALDDRAKAREDERRRHHYAPVIGEFWANGPTNPFDTFDKAA